ncbi:MAG: hypothetical protein AVDCRST_MAG65-1834, partial [uncultured Solirubrobacteraceae bacterium]
VLSGAAPPTPVNAVPQTSATAAEKRPD